MVRRDVTTRGTLYAFFRVSARSIGSRVAERRHEEGGGRRPAPCDRKSIPANEVPDPEPLDAAKQPPIIDRYCDLVLTGGVTDGVIYPWAILETRACLSFQKHRRHLRRRAGSGGDGGGGFTAGKDSSPGSTN